MSGEAILSAVNTGKTLRGRYYASNPTGGAYSVPQTPLDGGEGLAVRPLVPRPPLSAFGLDVQLFSLGPNETF